MNKTELKDKITQLFEYMGTAHCSGYKSRLPHCDSCHEEDLASAEEQKMYNLQAEVIAILDRQPDAAGQEPVAYVGFTQDGEIAYSQKEPADDLTPLYAAAPQPTNESANEVDERKEFDKWFIGEQGKPYDGMWEFARAAWDARASLQTGKGNG